MRHLVLFVTFAILLLGARPAPGADLYGVPWNADGLANLEIGKASGRIITVRFRAASSQLTDVRFFLVFRALGYYAGDGGQVRVDLERDDGSGFPDGASLDHLIIASPMTDPLGSWQHWHLSAALNPGSRYHLVFTNPAPDPVHNYVSLDDLSLSRGEANPLQPAVPDADWGITWRYSASDPWERKTNHSPIAEFDYADGTVQGCGYINAHTSGPVSIAGQGVAEAFTPSADMTVSAVAMRFMGSGTATLRLLLPDGSTAWSRSVTAPADHAFVSANLAAPYVLRRGTAYRLQLSGSSGSVYHYQKGGNHGWNAYFHDGRAQKWNGSAWVDEYAANYADWAFYFTVSAAPPPAGTGLLGQYWSGQTGSFNGAPTLSRTDATVDFDWGSGSPSSTISPDHFSARWTGSVKPPASGIWSFATVSDDGVRLWVNNQLLIDNWTDHPPTVNGGAIALAGGTLYPIRLEYYENAGGAAIHLLWSGPATAVTANAAQAANGGTPVPTEVLYPAEEAASGEPGGGSSRCGLGTGLGLLAALGITLRRRSRRA